MDSSKSVWTTLGVSENLKYEHSLFSKEKHIEYVSSDLLGKKHKWDVVYILITMDRM